MNNADYSMFDTSILCSLLYHKIYARIFFQLKSTNNAVTYALLSKKVYLKQKIFQQIYEQVDILISKNQALQII